LLDHAFTNIFYGKMQLWTRIAMIIWRFYVLKGRWYVFMPLSTSECFRRWNGSINICHHRLLLVEMWNKAKLPFWMVWRIGCITPVLFNLGMCGQSYAPAAVSPATQFSVPNGWSNSRIGCFGREIKFACPCREMTHNCSVAQPVALSLYGVNIPVLA
jgi:hypothetical protein